MLLCFSHSNVTYITKQQVSYLPSILIVTCLFGFILAKAKVFITLRMSMALLKYGFLQFHEIILFKHFNTINALDIQNDQLSKQASSF